MIKIVKICPVNILNRVRNMSIHIKYSLRKENETM